MHAIVSLLFFLFVFFLNQNERMYAVCVGESVRISIHGCTRVLRHSKPLLSRLNLLSTAVGAVGGDRGSDAGRPSCVCVLATWSWASWGSFSRSVLECFVQCLSECIGTYLFFSPPCTPALRFRHLVMSPISRTRILHL